MKIQLNVRNMVCIINIVTVKEYNMEIVIYTAYKTKTLEVKYPRSNVQYVLRHPTLHITESWTDFVENNDILLTVDMIILYCLKTLCRLAVIIIYCMKIMKLYRRW